MNAPECAHERVSIETYDQTLCIVCLDCNERLAYCWFDQHIPEALWNRACKNSTGVVPCKKDRDNICALCSARIKVKKG